jgi:hypothetical protein
LREAFGPLATDKPFPDSTFGPAPAEERPNTGCAILYGFDFGDNSGDEPGGLRFADRAEKEVPEYRLNFLGGEKREIRPLTTDSEIQDYIRKHYGFKWGVCTQRSCSRFDLMHRNT